MNLDFAIIQALSPMVRVSLEMILRADILLNFEDAVRTCVRASHLTTVSNPRNETKTD